MVVVGGFQRLGDLVRITANVVIVESGQVKKTVKVDGRIGDIFALQDKIVFDLTQGLNVALRGTEVADIERRETKSVEAYESFARGMMNLRLATRDSIERAISRIRRGHAEQSGIRHGVGRPGRRIFAQGLVPEHSGSGAQRARHGAEGTRARPRPVRRTQLEGRGPPDARESGRGHRLDPGSHQDRSWERAGAPDARTRSWVGKGDFSAAIPVFERSIVLNPDAGYSYLQLGLLLSWERRYAEAERVLRRAVELQDQFISGNAGLQMVGANARLGYVYYLQGRYDDAIREYERGVSFLQTSDHALKERSLIELEVKLGAAYHRAGRMENAKKHFDKAVKTFEARVAKGADDPFTRYYIADLHALRGDADRAFDSLERVYAVQPALTAARIAPRPRSRVAERRSAIRPFRGGPHRARRGVNAAGARARGFGARA